ncbi:MAG: xylulokinase [Spirochaetales bacterium]|uniref:Xylulose kinase n=1 Tax=Candidatus Thalassospirochaeta sargassi TaxID=3119039 RepID=A0AAJ1IER6_9SPIO|nr:xylulokinase [Spirochaetales bacterium]
MKTVLGIDVGTQSSKVLFYDYESKKVAAVASAPHELITGSDGTSEQEARWWIEAIRAALVEIPEEVRRTAIAAGVSGQQHGFVPVGEDGMVLHRVKLWNDTSTAAECGELTDAFGGEKKLIKEAGNPVLPGYTASKILWFKKNYPEEFSRMEWVMLPHDYINYFLTGEVTMEYGDASGTGLLNIRERTWNVALAAAIDPDLPNKLPPLYSPEHGAGKVTAEAATYFGIPEGIPVSCGGGDNMMASIGTGAVVPGVLSMSLGTSGTLFGYSDKPVIDEDGIIAAFCSSSGGWMPLLCTMNCTVATEQARELFDTDIKELERLVAEVPPGADGVTVLPYFSGERIPNMPHAKASIMGLNMNNLTRGNILAASMESAIYGMKIGLESLTRLGMTAAKIVLTGGGSRNPIWRQMAADITGLPVVILSNHDSAALGAAVQALWQVEQANGAALETLVDEHILSAGSETINPENVEAYKEPYNRYTEYLGNLKNLYV